MTKFCKDCKHAEPDPFFKIWAPFFGLKWKFAKCTNTRVPYNAANLNSSGVGDFLASGRGKRPDTAKPMTSFCSTARELGFMCGRDAEFFEPRRAK